jgi:outer membrane protein
MKRCLLIISGLLATLPWLASAQSRSNVFTLEQSINYALENSITLKNAALDERIADGRVKETRGIGLPQVDGNVTLRHNQTLPRFFSRYSVAQSFSGVDANGNPVLDIPGLGPDDVVASPNFFQLKSSGDAGISVNQILFNSSYLVGLQAANAYRELSVKTTNQTREQVIQNVSKAFYTCLINKDRVKLFESNIARVDTLLRNTKALYENGFAEGIEVDRIRVTLNNLTVERNKFLKLQEVALQLLKFQMDYPMDQPLDVSGDLSAVQVDEQVLNNYSLNWDYSQRTDYQILESNRRLQGLDLKNKYSESLPSLTAFANLGYTTQSPNVSGIFKTNTNLQDNGMIGPDKWYPYSAFGVSLNVPIFSGLQRNYRIQQAKLNMMKIENNFTSLKAAIDLEIKQSATNYLNAVESVKAQQLNRQLAENVARVTKIKYEQGVGSNLEVIQAETDLREAQINYYNALYDAIVAKIELDKAYGRILTNDKTSK